MWRLLTKDSLIRRYDQRYEPDPNNVKHWIMILVKFVGEKYNYHKHGIIRRKINTVEDSKTPANNDSLKFSCDSGGCAFHANNNPCNACGGEMSDYSYYNPLDIPITL